MVYLIFYNIVLQMKHVLGHTGMSVEVQWKQIFTVKSTKAQKGRKPGVDLLMYSLLLSASFIR